VKPETLNTVGLRVDGGRNSHAVFERRSYCLREVHPRAGGIMKLEIGDFGHPLSHIVGGLGR